MKILVQRLSDGRWLAWLEGTTDRASSDTMAGAVIELLARTGRIERVFGGTV